jgi:NADH-quinone oxidoreductase subunit L
MFLGSGSVIHGMHDEQDMRRMGALRKAMPVTAITFIVGWLAIAGIPPFAGFWSKDEILLYAWGKSPVLWAIGLVTALLTAYYMTRQVVMVFFGPPRWDAAEPHHGDETEPVPQSVGAMANPDQEMATDDHGPREHGHGVQPHESPWTMLLPLVVLAALSVVGGGLNLPFSKDLHFLDHWLEPVVGEFQASTPDVSKLLLALIAAAVAVVGLVLGFLVYARHRARAVEPEVLANAWYVDRAYAGLVGGSGRRLFDTITYDVDKGGVDGAVNGVGMIFRDLGGLLRRLQTGFVRNYALAVAGGAALVLAWFVSRGVL